MRDATAIKERPMIFSGPMVRAILDGTKTQTRRIVKPQPTLDGGIWTWKNCQWTDEGPRCPVGAMNFPVDYAPHPEGSRIWVRETWRAYERETDLCDGILYEADSAFVSIENTRAAADNWVAAYNNGKYKWRPSIFMPRWASRITLEITDVRVQRLQDITPEDCAAEGIEPVPEGQYTMNPQRGYYKIMYRWNETHGIKKPEDRKSGKSWQENPWVWCYTFKRITGSE